MLPPRCISGSPLSAWAAATCNPEGLIAAQSRTMLPTGQQKKFFYLSIDLRPRRSPLHSGKQEIHQIQVADGYPKAKELSVRGSENPNLMPEGQHHGTQFHLGRQDGAPSLPARTSPWPMYDLLGYHIKANPKYGSEKKGQPTTYYLSAAPEPIRVNADYVYVDVVHLQPDPNVFRALRYLLAGLKKGGVFVLQAPLPTPAEVWAGIPQEVPADHRRQQYSPLLHGRFQDRP